MQLSARTVADMLVVAHAGFEVASRTNDPELLSSSLELAGRALQRRDAGDFFAALSVALSETHVAAETHVPDIGDGTYSKKKLFDGSANTPSPVDAGSIPHDGKVTSKDLDHADELEPATAMLVRHRSPRPTPLTDVQRSAVRALR